jgi:hypothetical protein
MKFWKTLCCLGFLGALVSNIWSMSDWSESRGVYDDICYLRQAHLFQKHGLGGLDTNIARDEDHYLANKLREINFPAWNDPTASPCHVLMSSTEKRVLQYPPGTGFMLALFPPGFQVIPLYALASVVAFGFAILAVTYASTLYSLMLVAGCGDAAIYLMINPSKASYSMAPTMMVCALAGFLTAKLFVNGERRFSLGLLLLVGFLIGFSVNFRLANLFLSAGYGLFFLVSFLLSRNRQTFVQGLLFAGALLVGIAPTLLANAINAGSPFTTTYGAADVTPPELKSDVLLSYAADAQFVLLLIAGVWTALLLRFTHRGALRKIAIVTGGNLFLNIAFFMSHPIYTPYYTIPVAMLSLWTLLFACVLRPLETGDGGLLKQAAKA